MIQLLIYSDSFYSLLFFIYYNISNNDYKHIIDKYNNVYTMSIIDRYFFYSIIYIFWIAINIILFPIHFILKYIQYIILILLNPYFMNYLLSTKVWSKIIYYKKNILKCIVVSYIKYIYQKEIHILNIEKINTFIGNYIFIWVLSILKDINYSYYKINKYIYWYNNKYKYDEISYNDAIKSSTIIDFLNPKSAHYLLVLSGNKKNGWYKLYHYFLKIYILYFFSNIFQNTFIIVPIYFCIDKSHLKYNYIYMLSICIFFYYMNNYYLPAILVLINYNIFIFFFKEIYIFYKKDYSDYIVIDEQNINIQNITDINDKDYICIDKKNLEDSTNIYYDKKNNKDYYIKKSKIVFDNEIYNQYKSEDFILVNNDSGEMDDFILL